VIFQFWGVFALLCPVWRPLSLVLLESSMTRRALLCETNEPCWMVPVPLQAQMYAGDCEPS
jgi:hypothetical protein